MLISLLLILLGFVLLIKGADWLIKGASALAKKHNVSDLAIGLTVVAFGTSAPELVVNTFAAYQKHSDIVFGNIIGSNIFNLFATLGLTGVIMPLVIQSSTVWKEIPFSFVAIVFLFVLANDLYSEETFIISRLDGLVLLLMFLLFLLYIKKQLRSEPEKLDIQIENYSIVNIWLFIIIGLAGLIVGGRLVVNSAIQIATILSISEKIIALTIVAAGTSLPELATSVVAAIRKKTDIAVGNIIGSNIFNIFLILSISSLVRPVTYSTVFNTDLLLLAGGTIFLFLAMFTGQRHKLDRWEAAILLICYLGYTLYLINRES